MITPDLTFDGNAADAMRFYRSVLGVVLSMQTFGEAKMARSNEEESTCSLRNSFGEIGLGC